MNDSEIYEKLTPVFRDVFDDETLIPTATMSAEDVEDWDSLSHIRLVVAVEKAFSIRFSTAELGTLKTVADLAGLIAAKAH
jgi:acyl carrier protein